MFGISTTIVPALTLAAHRLYESRRPARPLVGLLAVVALGASATSYVDFRAGWREYAGDTRPALELTPRLASAPLADPEYSSKHPAHPNATRQRLERLIETDRWNPTTIWSDDVQARVSLRAGVTQRETLDAAIARSYPTGATLRTGTAEPLDTGGCWRVVAAWPDESARIDLGTRGVIELTWPTASVVLRIVDRDGTELASDTVDLSRGSWIGFETLVGSVELVAPGPRIEVCNVAPTTRAG